MKIHEKYVAQRRSHSIWHRPIRPIYFHAWNKLWLFIPDVRKLCSCCAHAPVHIFNIRGHFATDYVVLLHFRVARASHRLTVLAGNVFRIVFYSLRCYVLRSWTPHLVELLFLWLLLFTIEVGNSKLFFFFSFSFFSVRSVSRQVWVNRTHTRPRATLSSLVRSLWIYGTFDTFNEISMRLIDIFFFVAVTIFCFPRLSSCCDTKIPFADFFLRLNETITLWLCGCAYIFCQLSSFHFFPQFFFFLLLLYFVSHCKCQRQTETHTHAHTRSDSRTHTAHTKRDSRFSLILKLFGCSVGHDTCYINTAVCFSLAHSLRPKQASQREAYKQWIK